MRMPKSNSAPETRKNKIPNKIKKLKGRSSVGLYFIDVDKRCRAIEDIDRERDIKNGFQKMIIMFLIAGSILGRLAQLFYEAYREVVQKAYRKEI